MIKALREAKAWHDRVFAEINADHSPCTFMAFFAWCFLAAVAIAAVMALFPIWGPCALGYYVWKHRPGQRERQRERDW